MESVRRREQELWRREQELRRREQELRRREARAEHGMVGRTDS